jgi:uncharacterized RDD family membrane protein YckC
MKCQSCEQEYTGRELICGNCGHRHQSEKVSAPSAGIEANLIPFPRQTAGGAHTAGAGVSDAPTWRNEVRERVRQFRAQRASVAASEEYLDHEDLSANPVVEAALKRLQRPPEEVPQRKTRPLSTSIPREALVPTKKETPSAEPVFMAEPVLSEPIFLNEADDISEVKVIPPARPQENRPNHQRSTGNTSSGKPPTRVVVPDPDQDLYKLPVAQQTYVTPQVSLTDRILAGFFDIFILSIACFPIIYFHTIKSLIFDQPEIYTQAGIIVWMTFIYQLSTLIAGGRTWGMAWRQMKVVDTTNVNGRLPLWRIFMRAVAGTIAFLLPPLNLIFIWTSGNQASLSDLASGTMIMRGQGSTKPSA